MTTVTSEFAADLAREVEMAIFLRTLGKDPLNRPMSVTRDSHDLKTSFRVQAGNGFDGGVGVAVWCAPDPEPLAENVFEYDADITRNIALLIEKAEEEFLARPERMELIHVMAELDPAPDLEALRVWCEENGITRSGPELTVEDCHMMIDWLTLPEIRKAARERAKSALDLGDDSINFSSF